MKRIDRFKREDETVDRFYRGRFIILQKKKGYRFSVDAPLLADFIRTRLSDDLLELGTGSGIISILVTIKPLRSITALEVQPSLSDLARRNVALNGLDEKITVVDGDLRMFQPGTAYDVVFSNAPYIKKRSGYLSSSEEKSIAKHEIKCDIFDVVQRTSEVLRDNGRAYFIFPEKRRADFIQAVEGCQMRLKAVRFVQARRETAAHLFLAECRRAADEVLTLPPLVLYDEKGKYTEEAEEIFSGRKSAEIYQQPEDAL